MPSSLFRPARLLLVTLLAVALIQLSPSVLRTANAAPPAADDLVSTLGDPVPGLSDYDGRGTALPSAGQQEAAKLLDATVRWNELGTPASIFAADGNLGTFSGDFESAARSWLADHQALLGVSEAQISSLELVNEQKFADSDAVALLFRQKFGNLTPAIGSMVTVGMADGKIVYVSSSLTKTTTNPADAELSPVQGWLKAAENVGKDVGLTDLLADAEVEDGWTRFRVKGFAQEQLARVRALALADGKVRPVIEANVVDVQGGSAQAYTSLVDAVTGDVLHRQNQVENSSDVYDFSGEITATDCGPRHPIETTDDATKQIVVTATAANPSNDIVIKLYDPDGNLLTSGDTGTSPEALTYTADSIPQGIYEAEVCPYDAPTVPFVPPGNYVGAAFTSDVETPEVDAPFPPVWKYFAANPVLNFSPDNTTDNRVVGCWETTHDGAKVDGCTNPLGQLDNPAANMPWDVDPRTNLPTFTTIGNNASTHEAWLSPLTPGGLFQAPISVERRYEPEFTDAWNNSGCDPAELVPGGNDVEAAVGSLFVAHNRMHDYSWFLGFNESNYNMQTDNSTGDGVAGDPEIGNAQAGAITGGAPSYLGRDNANQITLQDGVPGITNQYLFQPIAAAFYSPCADGDLDMSIVGHEYTHAITNRMIAGPDAGITSEQGGAMGESWSDLVAAEYLWSHGYATGGNPWAVGPYATGNGKAGIRDYAINKNPLNYGNYGFDSTGDEVHADGEIWNGTQWTVRQALVKRWNFKYPYDNKRLQRKCAEERAHQGPRRAQTCPGNRRWVQLMFDSFLLQQSATSMLDARDAMIAADAMRFKGGPDRKVMWDAFAKRGMGKGASTPNADSGKTRPSFASPKSRNGKVRFRAPKGGKVYVGRYEARSTPVADTVGKTKRDARASFVPGRYEMLYVSAARGFERFTMRVRPGKQAVRVSAPKNLAAAKRGAEVLATSADSRNPGFLLDGTEATNWGGVNAGGENVDEQSPFVAVDLAGKVHKVRRVNVSAMLNPAPASGTEIPFAVDEDPDSGSRFTALRRFALEACVRGCGSDDATWKRFYVSKADAFPGKRPRPVAPNLILRSFDVPDVKAAAIRIVALENQCTGFSGYAGEQDNDPLNPTDCKTGSDRGSIVHVAELQVYGG